MLKKEGMLTGDLRMEEQIRAYKRKAHDICRDPACVDMKDV